ncbi:MULTISPECIES: flagellar basal body-associated protein FliL [Roseobacter]|uniref:flagellar basal body-associated protein FliL n=1 Tax=Roseobacter TaxID=2433 RepID=UPI001BBAAE61|nr:MULTISPECIES: flagellar basal body-associated protein FliL [Roseobacter]GIT86488.1 flagellar basal body-associated protein FliL [Roseobacter sp. OBYS 0001]
MKKILPILMLLLGSAAGVGAGVYLRPPPAEEAAAPEELAEESSETTAKEEAKDELPIAGKEYVKLSNQFVVPIVEKDRVSSMIVMTLSVEAPEGQGQAVYDLEPKIRDVFLRILFDHAAIGGFRGAFLNNENLDIVRRNLRDGAIKTFGQDLISDVLIFEIARQDY